MRACPELNGILNIGDQVLQIDKGGVPSLAAAKRFFRQNTTGFTVELVLRRLPLAKVLAITRKLDRQPLGIRREGGTAEVRRSFFPLHKSSIRHNIFLKLD